MVQPLRARCRGCQAAHILLPAEFVFRRADHVEVIAEALALSAVEGFGHRKVSQILHRPESTVRDWIRTFKTNIPAKTATAHAMDMLMAHARALSHLHSTAQGLVVAMTWHDAALFAHGSWFFSGVG